MATLNLKMRQRYEPAADWTSSDPTLLAGEIGWESDTGKFKVGDGSTAWSALAYYTATPSAHATSHETGGSDPIDALTFANTGLKILDTIGDHELIIACGDDLNADRTLSIVMNDADRQVSLGGNLTTAGAVTVTAAAATVLDDASVSAMVDTLGGASATGSGGLVRATSPTLVTPALGTPSALVATNATGTATGLTSGITNALKSATTTVDVSAATAPSTGQVLTATGASAATWQAPNGYCLYFGCVNTTTWVDATPTYVGARMGNAATTGGLQKVRIPKTGTIKVAYVHTYSVTAGSNESWSTYVRVNNTTDTLIQALAASTNEREWSNTALSIAVTQGDYIEIKFDNPTWGTNPANITVGGHIYIE